MAREAVEGPVKDLENPRTRYRNFSDTEIVLSVAKPNEQFAVLLAGDDGLVWWLYQEGKPLPRQVVV